MEALIALVLVALGAGALGAVAATSGRALVAARRDGAGASLALGRLDALRAGPRLAGTDAVGLGDGTTVVRRWTATAGRGRPDLLGVDVAWPGHAFDLATEALP